MSSTATTAAPASSRPYQRLPRIDVHTHILPEHIPDLHARYGYGDWIRLDHHCACKARMYKGDAFFREIEDNCYRVDPRLRDCDEANVTVQVLSTVPVMFSYWAKPDDALDVSRLLNDHIAAICTKHPRRFVGLGTIPLQAPELAIAELKRCADIGLCGVQIGSHVNDMPLSHPSLFPVFQACEELGLAVFVHPWDMAGEQLMKKYWLPWLVGMPAESSFAICSMIFGGIFERLPKLRVCFAHGGGSFPGTIGRIEHGFEARPDLVAIDNPHNPRKYLGHFFVDCLTHDPVALRHVIDLLGLDKVVLGTDYPFPLGELQPGLMVEQMQSLDEEQKRRILWRNALIFLGLEHKEKFFLGEGSEQGKMEEAETTKAKEQEQEQEQEQQETSEEEVDAALRDMDQLRISSA